MMYDEQKTKEQLIEELALLRRRLAELEHAEKDRSRAEEALRASETKFRALTESSPSVIFISRDDRLLYMNPAGLQLGGYSLEELLAMPVWSFVHPEMQELIKERALNRLKNINGLPSRYEVKVVTRDGRIKWFDYTPTIIEYEGKPALLGNAFDITDRKAAEEELRLKAMVLDQIQDRVTVTDLNGRITYVNEAECRSLKLPREELIGQSVESYGEDPTRGATQRQIIEMTRAKGEWRGEVVNYASDGSEIILDCRTRVLWDEEGRPIALYGISTDITERKTADEALRNSENLFRTLAETTASAIFIGRIDRLIYMNPACQKIWGYDWEEAQKVYPWGFVHPDMQEFVRAAATARLRKEGYPPSRYEMKILTKDGQVKWLDFTPSLIDYKGESAILGTAFDITDRKRIEKALEENERIYKDAIELAGAVPYYQNYLTNTYDYVGEGIQDLIGCSPQEFTPQAWMLLEKDIHLLGGLQNLSVEEAVRKARGEEGISWRADYCVKMRSGEEKWIANSAVQVRDDNGKVIGSFGILQDITERKRTEEALATEKERLKVTLHSIGDGVIATDSGGIIVLINTIAEKLTGWTESEALGRRLEEVFHIINEITRKRCENPADLVLKSGKIVDLANQTILIAKDGTERILADSGAPIRDRNSRIIGVVLVFRDVTEKRLMESELFNARKLESVGMLAGGIAHDFNNLLTAILGNISLAKSSINPQEKIYKRLSEAEKASLRAQRLTQQLLTFSKGGAPIKELASIADIASTTASFVLSGSNTRCEYDFADDLLPVFADKGQIGQVIHNMILNAEQAMPEGGTIHIRSENVRIGSAKGRDFPALSLGEYVKLTIEDHGIGIPADHLSKIFDPYFTTKQNGNGLGLATAYSIVKKHGGIIMVQSEPGKGTIFSVYLPAYAGTILSEDHERDSISSPTRTGKILVMDDEDFVKETAGNMLIHLGYSPEFSKNGQEAIFLYQQALEKGEPFDAVIMDLTIPGGMGGIETIKELLKVHPQVKAIVSSGYSSDPVMANYQDYGFAGVIGKPYKLDELDRAIQKAMA
ncbi:MAG: PAS domain S-box protein [Candidatus Omnitrophota bacterium]